MATRFQHAALVGKYQAPGIGPMLEQVASWLMGLGLKVSLDVDSAERIGWTLTGALSVEEMGAQCDVAVVIGGDGTMLGIARQLAPHGVPLVGINQGRLGFITDVQATQWQEALSPIMHGEYEEEHRTLIEGAVWRAGQVLLRGLALNDMVVSRGAHSSMIEMRVEAGGEFIANIRADGLIVATPTGSTAYALSAGGPILHPAIGGWVLVPLASHTLTNRPIVLPDHEPVQVRVVHGDSVSINFDMHGLSEIHVNDEVRLWRSALQVRFLHPKGWSYYATLRRKLRWYEGMPEGAAGGGAC